MKEKLMLEVRKVYNPVLFDDLQTVLEQKMTMHFSTERKERYQAILDRFLTKDDYFDAVLSVDRGHKDGCELHCITHNGLIFIFNEDKYFAKQDSLVTILLARVGQVTRYGAENYQPDSHTLEKCAEYQKNGDNYL